MNAIATLRRIATALTQAYDEDEREHVHPSIRTVRPPRTEWTSREWADDLVVSVRDSGVGAEGLDGSPASLTLVDEFVGLYAEHEVDLPVEVAEGAAGYFVQVVAASWRALSVSEAAALHASTRSFVAGGGSLGERYGDVVVG
ncbi:hypothetical protein [Aeromicrobium sp. IC_218]|uniref:hypothetical protein n=1 Tax=Aeromicrobium sp. IC_218 TaxID=2545468 RepID=UPI00103C2AD3|nr:hypothetical protein [Aeromicrobium sp. IC_218]TCI99070.1 hypothetical protein E0W78_07660 [Aeromicrobium sp. IC_218]